MGAASKGAPKWIVLLEYKMRKKIINLLAWRQGKLQIDVEPVINVLIVFKELLVVICLILLLTHSNSP